MKTVLGKLSIILLLLSFTITIAMGQEADVDKVVYRVTAYKNGNNNVFSQSNTAEIIAPFTIYVPNAFTPDGDGLNDIFIPVGRGVLEFSLVIYNRWGELVFESNDSKRGWDGTFKNEAAPAGSYVYKLVAKGNGTRRVERSGSVTIVFSS